MTIGRAVVRTGFALLLLGCGGVETYDRHLEVPLAGNPTGDALAKACVTKCMRRDDDYRIAVCLRGCPGVRESEGPCTRDEVAQPATAGCFTWKTEGRLPNVPEGPEKNAPGREVIVGGAVGAILMEALAGDHDDGRSAGPGSPPAAASQSPPPTHVPARPKKR